MCSTFLFLFAFLVRGMRQLPVRSLGCPGDDRALLCRVDVGPEAGEKSVLAAHHLLFVFSGQSRFVQVFQVHLLALKLLYDFGWARRFWNVRRHHFLLQKIALIYLSQEGMSEHFGATVAAQPLRVISDQQAIYKVLCLKRYRETM